MDRQESYKTNSYDKTPSTCSSCHQLFDLANFTPYKLPCGHTSKSLLFNDLACKKCLRQCHKDKKDYACKHDQQKITLDQLRTLSKNLDVIAKLRDKSKGNGPGGSVVNNQFPMKLRSERDKESQLSGQRSDSSQTQSHQANTENYMTQVKMQLSQFQRQQEQNIPEESTPESNTNINYNQPHSTSIQKFNIHEHKIEEAADEDSYSNIHRGNENYAQFRYKIEYPPEKIEEQQKAIDQPQVNFKHGYLLPPEEVKLQDKDVQQEVQVYEESPQIKNPKLHETEIKYTQSPPSTNKQPLDPVLQLNFSQQSSSPTYLQLNQQSSVPTILQNSIGQATHQQDYLHGFNNLDNQSMNLLESDGNNNFNNNQLEDASFTRGVSENIQINSVNKIIKRHLEKGRSEEFTIKQIQDYDQDNEENPHLNRMLEKIKEEGGVEEPENNESQYLKQIEEYEKELARMQQLKQEDKEQALNEEQSQEQAYIEDNYQEQPMENFINKQNLDVNITVMHYVDNELASDKNLHHRNLSDLPNTQTDLKDKPEETEVSTIQNQNPHNIQTLQSNHSDSKPTSQLHTRMSSHILNQLKQQTQPSSHSRVPSDLPQQQQLTYSLDLPLATHIQSKTNRDDTHPHNFESTQNFEQIEAADESKDYRRIDTTKSGKKKKKKSKKKKKKKGANNVTIMQESYYEDSVMMDEIEARSYKVKSQRSGKSLEPNDELESTEQIQAMINNNQVELKLEDQKMEQTDQQVPQDGIKKLLTSGLKSMLSIKNQNQNQNEHEIEPIENFIGNTEEIQTFKKLLTNGFKSLISQQDIPVIPQTNNQQAQEIKEEESGIKKLLTQGLQNHILKQKSKNEQEESQQQQKQEPLISDEQRKKVNKILSEGLKKSLLSQNSGKRQMMEIISDIPEEVNVDVETVQQIGRNDTTLLHTDQSLPEYKVDEGHYQDKAIIEDKKDLLKKLMSDNLKTQLINNTSTPKALEEKFSQLHPQQERKNDYQNYNELYQNINEDDIKLQNTDVYQPVQYEPLNAFKIRESQIQSLSITENKQNEQNFIPTDQRSKRFRQQKSGSQDVTIDTRIQQRGMNMRSDIESLQSNNQQKRIQDGIPYFNHSVGRQNFQAFASQQQSKLQKKLQQNQLSNSQTSLPEIQSQPQLPANNSVMTTMTPQAQGKRSQLPPSYYNTSKPALYRPSQKQQIQQEELKEMEDFHLISQKSEGNVGLFKGHNNFLKSDKSYQYEYQQREIDTLQDAGQYDQENFEGSLPPSRTSSLRNKPQNSHQEIHTPIESQSPNQQMRLVRPLQEICKMHPKETVKYFCRDSACMRGLCPDCIIEHSKHDFIAANELAALEIKQVLKQAQRKCKNQVRIQKEIRAITEKKLTDLNRQRNEEFQRLHCYFIELHKDLDEREAQLNALFNDEIKDIESTLMQDLQTVRSQYTDNVKIFKDLKNLYDQFCIPFFNFYSRLK